MPSLYDISVPTLTRALRNLDHLLVKASESGLNEADLLEARLASDMLPFTSQVQIACDTAKLAVMRIAETEPLPMADDEASLAALRERIARTITYLEAAPSTAFDGRETAPITLKVLIPGKTFTGLSMLLEFSLPNFFFHVATAYGLLRMKGVEIGKRDYLAGGDQAARQT